METILNRPFIYSFTKIVNKESESTDASKCLQNRNRNISDEIYKIIIVNSREVMFSVSIKVLYALFIRWVKLPNCLQGSPSDWGWVSCKYSDMEYPVYKYFWVFSKVFIRTVL